MKHYFTAEIKQVLDKAEMVKNLARKKFVTSFILALIESRKVQFSELAHHINDEVKVSSNEVRIQDFFREVDLDYQAVAFLLAMFLPKGKVTLCIDRTEWDFGQCQVNILMVVARSGSVHIPLYWELLDNRSGNSATEDRIHLIGQCITLLGKERIGMVVADREFIGHRWLKYLKDNGILFCIRLPKSHHIIRLDGRVQQAEALVSQQQSPLILQDCLVDGLWGHVYLKPLSNGDILFLFGTARADLLGQFYRKRWTIEQCFQSLKKRGFDLESTHLQDLYKLKKLLAFVSLAYGFCLSMGHYYNQKVKPIKMKNHGYKANSFFRCGLDVIRRGLHKDWRSQTEVFQRLVQRFLHWMNLMIDYKLITPLKIAG
jgi:hypothetical protein